MLVNKSTPFNPPPKEGGKTNQNISFLRIKTEGWHSKIPSSNLMKKSQSGTKPFLGQKLFISCWKKGYLSEQTPFPPSWEGDIRGWVAQTQHYSISTTKFKELCLCQ